MQDLVQTGWNRPWVLSAMSAIFLSLSFPPFDAAILQLPALIFLFRISILAKTKGELFRYTYPCFVLWNLFTTYWLMMASIPAGIAAILANALLMVIPLLLIRYLLRSGLHPWPASILVASVWTTYEFLHHNWDLSWPWLTLGNAWSNLTPIIQFISVTGVLGISFWVLLTSTLFFFAIERSLSKKWLITGFAVLLLLPAVSLISYSTYQADRGDPVEIAIIQPNSDSYEPYGGHSSLRALLENLLQLSGTVTSDETDLIIWPENAVDSAIDANHSFLQVISDSLDAWDASLITGAGFVQFYDESNKPNVYRESSSGSFYNVYNSALYLTPEEPLSVYKKNKLVPIVERFPFVDFLEKVDYFNWIDWSSIVGYGRGFAPTLFNVKETATPALICYDSVFPGWVNRFVKNGAGFLTIITNDGWWGDSNGHKQHFAYARLRAIEQRMWIARSANNGISGIIGPDGSIIKETEYWTEDAFAHTIYNSDNHTFFSRFGNWMGYLSLFLSVAGLGWLRFKQK